MNIAKELNGGIVLHKNGDVIQKRWAYMISRAIAETAGVEMTFGDVRPRRRVAKIALKDDKKLTGGDWKITIADQNITFAAGSYYGYSAIERFLRSEDGQAFYALENGYTAEGNYKTSLTALEQSTRYAYDKRGECRVMFYNVLFGHYGFRKKEDGKPLRDVPTPKRNPLQAEMVKQYMPDVIGCQEFNGTKRGDFVEYGPAIATHPHGDLGALFAKLGYKETCPRDVGYHPYYNNTPLFYNTKTTKLIKSEYFWYKDQIDDENRNNCGAGDCASKSITWGVFETKATGKRYIVLSTHMCTRSNGVRGLQAIEAVDLIKKLVAKYDCPAFLGGDFNGLMQHANYIYFTSEGVNYTDVALNGVAKEFASTARTHHTYPLYNKELDMEFVAPDDNTGENTNNIDHIMMTNADNVKVNVYGVVIDECSMSGSDHYPIFADFDL